MKNVINGRFIHLRRLNRHIPTRVAVAVKAREVTAGHLQPQAMTRQKNIGRDPQVEPQLVDFARLQQFRFCE